MQINYFRIQKLTEFGIMNKAFDDLPPKFTDGKATIILETKVSTKVMIPESALPFLKLVNTQQFWIVMASMIAVALIALTGEKLIHWLKAFRLRRRVRVVQKVRRQRPVTTKDELPPPGGTCLRRRSVGAEEVRRNLRKFS